jgi:methionyl aminopeptidase
MNYLDCYHKAGKIASEVRENTKKKHHVGSSLYEICESVEHEIKVLGGNPAFPVNVSLNDIAAHYTAEPDDTIVVKDGDVLKIDIGVHVEGFVADTAVTVCYNSKYDSLVRSADMALNEAIRITRASTRAADIGRVIESSISQHGFKPIQNLSGHSLEQFTIHAGKSIPNIKTIGSSIVLIANHAYAIEPFLTTKDGQGVVYEGKTCNIFSVISRKPQKEKGVNDFLQKIWNKYKTLPFSARWLTNEFEINEIKQLIEILRKKRNLHGYPILVEGNSKVVAQAEHTLIPSDSGADVITL